MENPQTFLAAWLYDACDERLLPSLILIALAVAGLEALRAASLGDVSAERWEPPADMSPAARRKAG